MNRDIEVSEQGNLKAKCCFRYHAVNTGTAGITLYKTEIVSPNVPGVPVPLLFYQKEFTHEVLNSLEEIRAFDKTFVSAELTEHAPAYNEQTWLINYDHDDIRTRFCVLSGDQVIGIAGCISNFTDNTSNLGFLSSNRLAEDRSYTGDRFGVLIVRLLNDLAASQQAALSVRAVN